MKFWKKKEKKFAEQTISVFAFFVKNIKFHNFLSHFVSPMTTGLAWTQGFKTL
jgi:hypothetical protein